VTTLLSPHIDNADTVVGFSLPRPTTKLFGNFIPNFFSLLVLHNTTAWQRWRIQKYRENTYLATRLNDITFQILTVACVRWLHHVRG